MFIYITIFLVLLFSALAEIFLSAFGKKSSWLFILILIIFWVLSFIRWETGTDWNQYIDYFVYNHSLSDFLSKHESGFALINFIVKKYTGSYTVLLETLGLIIFLCMGLTIYKLSQFPYISLLTLFCGFSFGYILFVRQHIAIAIMFFSLRYVVNRNFKAFLICLLLAISFHLSAIIFIIAYWIYPIKFKIKHYILLLIAGLSIGLVINELVLSHFAEIYGGFIGNKILEYLNLGTKQTYGTTLSLTHRLISGVVSRSFFIILTLIVFNKSRLKNPKVNGYLNIYFIGMIVFLVFTPVSLVFVRLADYNDIMLILLIPSIINEFRISTNRIVVLCILSVYMFKWLITSCIGDYKQYYIPYRTIFQQERFIN